VRPFNEVGSYIPGYFGGISGYWGISVAVEFGKENFGVWREIALQLYEYRGGILYLEKHLPNRLQRPEMRNM
jgi:hypothetical protein